MSFMLKTILTNLILSDNEQILLIFRSSYEYNGKQGNVKTLLKTKLHHR